MKILMDDLVVKAGFSASGSAEGYSTVNVGTNNLHKVWQSSSNNPTLNLVWGTSQTINGVALIASSLTTGDTIAVVSKNIGGTVLASSTITLASDAVVPSGFDNALNSAPYGGGQSIFIPLEEKNTVSRVELSFTSRVIQIPRVVAGDWIDVGRVLAHGTSIGWKDNSEQLITEAGSIVVNRQPMNQLLELSVVGLNPKQKNTLDYIIRRVGTHSPVGIQSNLLSCDSNVKEDIVMFGYFQDITLMQMFGTSSSTSMRVRSI